jgi:hypothetical protein
VDNAIEILAFLVGVSGGVFLLIALFVLSLGRSTGSPAGSDGAVWLGGPFGSEHGVGETSLVLTGRRANWDATPDVDWRRMAETSEPGARIGGASAGW